MGGGVRDLLIVLVDHVLQGFTTGATIRFCTVGAGFIDFTNLGRFIFRGGGGQIGIDGFIIKIIAHTYDHAVPLFSILLGVIISQMQMVRNKNRGLFRVAFKGKGIGLQPFGFGRNGHGVFCAFG